MLLRLALISTVLLANVYALLLPASALADPGTMLISELQTGSAASAGDEFVEFYNPGGADVNLSGWKLQYHAGLNPDCSDKTWSNKTILGPVTIRAHGFFLLSSAGYLASADANFNSGLAYDGGAVRLVDGGGTIADSLAWGNATCGNDNPAPAPAGGSSLERRYSTGHNATDFQVRSTPQPQSTSAPTETLVTGYAPAPASSADGPATVELTEVFPDPAPPLTDASDEFIEIYNPNPGPVSLTGYVIKTGATLSTKHTLRNTVVAPAGYVSFKSSTTKIALANSGSSVALFDPNGRQLGPTVSYGHAPTGDAWARGDDDSWSWTTTPTPGSPNILTQPDPASLAASTGAKSTAAKSQTAGAKASKAAAKSTKPKTAKAKITKLAAPALAAATSPGGHWLLLTLAGLTIAYVIYEFRYDLRNLYYRLRGITKPRGSTGQTNRGR
jgi:hypothetical protein